MSEIQVGKFKVQTRESDGYINATQLCKAGNKRFKDWHKKQSTKVIIDSVNKKLSSLSSQTCVHVQHGGVYSGTWIHPLLATHVAQWISPEFCIQVSMWVEEWKNLHPNHTLQYFDALSKLQPSKNNQDEKEIQLRLQRVYGGEIEVQTPAGFIDLMNDNTIIEIKRADKWKSAIGQVLSYGIFYPHKKLKIVLFGDINYDAKTVEYVCRKYNIDVCYL